MAATGTSSGYLTTPALVEGVLLADYDFNQNPDLTPFIATADAMIPTLIACAARKCIALDPALLVTLETWLAGHAYVMSDQNYSERRTLRASGKFQGQTGKGLEGSKYGQMAMMMDPSGCLRNASTNSRARLHWGGKRCQITYWYYWNGGSNCWCQGEGQCPYPPYGTSCFF